MDEQLNMAADQKEKLIETPMVSADSVDIDTMKSDQDEDEDESAPSTQLGLHAPADHEDEDEDEDEDDLGTDEYHVMQSFVEMQPFPELQIQEVQIQVRPFREEVLVSSLFPEEVRPFPEVKLKVDIKPLCQEEPLSQPLMCQFIPFRQEQLTDQVLVHPPSPPEVLHQYDECFMPLSEDANMKIEKETLNEGENSYRHASSTTTTAAEDEYYCNSSSAAAAAKGSLMDPRIYAHATTQGDDIDGFIKILESISGSSKNDQLEHSKILCQISHRGNTCLHIAASFGHHELAKYIVGKCPDVVKMKNSDDDDTPLHIAARKRDLSFVKIFMDSCRDLEMADKTELLEMVNKEGNTVLHEALINHCKEEEVVEIIQLAKSVVHDYPQLAYYLNKEGKSPLYLAVEANYFHVVHAIAKSDVKEPPMENGQRGAKPAIHAAILGKNKVMLEKILGMKRLVHQKDKDGKTPLHCAASIGYLEGVQKLLENQSNFDRYEMDYEGLCPIHVASRKGYVDIIKQLLRFSPDSKELISRDGGENFLHVAARFGAEKVVDFVFKNKWLENLINEKDRHGNTPLHLATMFEHPKVVNYLTWDKRVDLNLVNGEGQTALDIAVSVEHPTSFHQRLIWTALKSAGARPAGNSEAPPSRRRSKTPNTEEYKDRVNTLLLVSTLVVTVTFAAGFTMPGGYNSSDPNVGMATLLVKNMFHAFVICNTLALYTSILAAITLIWAQLGDLNLMDTALRFALPFLGVALTAMSLGFTAGVYLVVSNLHWLANVVLSIGIICLVILFVPFLLLFLPSKNTNCILRYISYYPFLILVWASQSHEIKR